MADSASLAIVEAALSLQQTRPDWHALRVLDEAMRGHEGADLDFSQAGNPAFEDWTDPPSPFGELLRRAFAAEAIPVAEAAGWKEEGSGAPARDKLLERWQELVIERFAERYSAWRG